MPSKTFEHKFEIGDLVSIIQSVKSYEQLKIEGAEKYMRLSYLPQHYLVIGLWAEYCYGGLQIHYKIKHSDKSGALLISDYTEVEVCEPYKSKEN